MELSLSDLCARNITLPSGVAIRLTGVLIDSQNGRLLAGKFSGGFLPFRSLVPTEQDRMFQGAVEEQSSGENWLGFRVENRKGHKRGRVMEIWIDLLSFQVVKIEAENRFLKLWKKKRIYPVGDIFEVLPAKKLIVVEEQNRVFRKAEAALSELQQQMPAVNPSGCSSTENF